MLGFADKWNSTQGETTMKNLNCETCENSGVVYAINAEVEYCFCDFGVNKQFHDELSDMKQGLVKKMSV